MYRVGIYVQELPQRPLFTIQMFEGSDLDLYEKVLLNVKRYIEFVSNRFYGQCFKESTILAFESELESFNRLLFNSGLVRRFIEFVQLGSQERNGINIKCIDIEEFKQQLTNFS